MVVAFPKELGPYGIAKLLWKLEEGGHDALADTL